MFIIIDFFRSYFSGYIMWCSLSHRSSIEPERLRKLRSFLFEEEEKISSSMDGRDAFSSSPFSAEGSLSDESVRDWDVWNSDDDDDSADNLTTVEIRVEERNGSWLDKVLISSSATGDVFVFARGNRFVLLRNKPQLPDTVSASSRDDISSISSLSSVSENSFHIVVSKETDEPITVAFCLQLVSSQKSSSHLPDWTAVIFGTESGALLFYRDRGTLI